MKPITHIDLDVLLASQSPIILELGCGTRQNKGRIGIDYRDLPGVDIVADLEKGLPFFPDNSVDEIHSKSLLEHIDNFEFLMREIWRVLKPTGKQYLFVPHFSNPYYYSDYTHKRFFGLYTFQYFSERQSGFHRKVPNFYIDFSFDIAELTLEFKSPWRGRNFVKRIAHKIFNRNVWWQEFYEENLCYVIPCYGIRAVLYPKNKYKRYG